MCIIWHRSLQNRFRDNKHGWTAKTDSCSHRPKYILYTNYHSSWRNAPKILSQWLSICQGENKICAHRDNEASGQLRPQLYERAPGDNGRSHKVSDISLPKTIFKAMSSIKRSHTLLFNLKPKGFKYWIRRFLPMVIASRESGVSNIKIEIIFINLIPFK